MFTETLSSQSLAVARRFHFYRGRTALYAILRALDLQPQDEVIVQAYTCLAVVLPIIGLGAVPIYADIDPCTYTLDPASVEARISKRSKVLVVQHTFGVPANLDRLMDIARRHGLYLVEDCCHVSRSTYRGATVGSFGIAAFYSYQWTKPIVVGRGGVAVTTDRQLAQRLKELHSSFDKPSRYDETLINLQYLIYNSIKRSKQVELFRRVLRLLSPSGIASGALHRRELEFELTGDYQKQMASSILRRLDSKLADGLLNGRRLPVSQRLHSSLVELGVSPLDIPDEREVGFLRYPIVPNDPSAVIDECRDMGIEIGRYFCSPVDPLPADQWSRARYRSGSCPIAEYLSQRTVTFPIHHWSGESDVDKILSQIMKLKRRYEFETSTSRWMPTLQEGAR